MKKEPKVHGPSKFLRQLFCGNEMTANVRVSASRRDWTCGRCISKGLRADIAQLRATSIATTGKRRNTL